MFVMLFTTLLWCIDFSTREFYKYPVTEITSYDDGQAYGGTKTVCCRQLHLLKKSAWKAGRVTYYSLILTLDIYGGWGRLACKMVVCHE